MFQPPKQVSVLRDALAPKSSNKPLLTTLTSFYDGEHSVYIIFDMFPQSMYCCSIVLTEQSAAENGPQQMHYFLLFD